MLNFYKKKDSVGPVSGLEGGGGGGERWEGIVFL